MGANLARLVGQHQSALLAGASGRPDLRTLLPKEGRKAGYEENSALHQPLAQACGGRVNLSRAGKNFWLIIEFMV
jgi:hypothetical protein